MLSEGDKNKLFSCQRDIITLRKHTQHFLQLSVMLSVHILSYSCFYLRRIAIRVNVVYTVDGLGLVKEESNGVGFRKRDTRGTIPSLLGESPVLFDPSTPPINLPTWIFTLSYYSLLRQFTRNRKVM